MRRFKLNLLKGGIENGYVIKTELTKKLLQTVKLKFIQYIELS